MRVNASRVAGMSSVFSTAAVTRLMMSLGVAAGKNTPV